MIKKIKNTSANHLTQTVLAYLRLKGYMAWRQNNGGVWDPIKKIYRSNSSTRGVADIIAIKGGVCYMIEIKAGRDVLSDYQKNFRYEWERHGGKYIVVTDGDIFEGKL